MENNDKHTPAMVHRLDLENPGKWSSGKKIGLLIAIVLFLLIVVWAWKTIEISGIKKQAATERESLVQQATKQSERSVETHLQLLAKPFAWAIRTEMLNNNLSQVNLYLNEMVKEKNFQKIMIVNDKGIIIASTDKKEEGKAYLPPAGKMDLTATDTKVDNTNDSMLTVSSPLMGLNNRLGTLVFTYTKLHPVFN